MTKLSKIRFSGTIELESGLHIGGGDAFAAIGAADSTIVRDAVTNMPVIPGSSLKGKMRTLLARAYNEQVAVTPNDDDERITRLFGASSGYGKDGKCPLPARLIFRDSILTNGGELLERGADSYTEVKFENTINRVTAVANPRQIERAIRMSRFNFELIYDVVEEDEVEEDLDTILAGFRLLELDYLGGNGSRGYGKIKFDGLRAETVFGDYDVTRLNEKLEA